MQTPKEILSSMEVAGRPLLSSETLKSQEPILSEKESGERWKTPQLPRGPETKNPEFRRALLQLDEGHHPNVAKMARWAEGYVRAMSVNKISDGRCMAFSGSPGCGKTKAARGIYKFAQAYGPDLL